LHLTRLTAPSGEKRVKVKSVSWSEIKGKLRQRRDPLRSRKWIKQKGNCMVAHKKDPIPESFSSPESAGDFWDTHSLADYENKTKKVEIDFQITNLAPRAG